MMLKIAFMGLGSRGRDVYLHHLCRYNDVEVTALCDIKAEKVKIAKEKYRLNNALEFTDETEFFDTPRLADALVIATLDQDHYRQAKSALKKGYHLLLEKPVTDKAEEMNELVCLAHENNCKVMVCHVLRYAPYYVTIKSLIDSGAIGDVISINHQENVAYWHFSHSYVRGNWRNSETTAPSLLAKCCHDFDLINWYASGNCTTVSSVGGLSYFTKEYAPKDAVKICTDCPNQDCIYNTNRIYLSRKGELFGWRAAITGTPSPSVEATRKAIADTSYRQCVFYADNNVCDHQTTMLAFDNGVTATVTMNAFSKDCYRRTHIMGTKGEVIGEDKNKYLILNVFGKKSKRIRVKNGLGHLGGDAGICKTFYLYLTGHEKEVKSDYLTTLDVTAASHKIVYAAEQSRLSNKTVYFNK